MLFLILFFDKKKQILLNFENKKSFGIYHFL